jgi:hypothetical protein
VLAGIQEELLKSREAAMAASLGGIDNNFLKDLSSDNHSIDITSKAFKNLDLDRPSPAASWHGSHSFLTPTSTQKVTVTFLLKSSILHLFQH